MNFPQILRQQLTVSCEMNQCFGVQLKNLPVDAAVTGEHRTRQFKTLEAVPPMNWRLPRNFIHLKSIYAAEATSVTAPSGGAAIAVCTACRSGAGKRRTLRPDAVWRANSRHVFSFFSGPADSGFRPKRVKTESFAVLLCVRVALVRINCRMNVTWPGNPRQVEPFFAVFLSGQKPLSDLFSFPRPFIASLDSKLWQNIPLIDGRIQFVLPFDQPYSINF